MEKSEDLLSRNIDYGNRYREYIRFVRSYPVLNSLWEKIGSEELIRNAPKSALIVIGDALHDLELIESTAGIDDDIVKTKHLLELAEKASAEDMSRIGTRIDTIEKETGQHTKQLQYLRESLKKSNLMRSRVQTMLGLEDKIIKLQEKPKSWLITGVAGFIDTAYTAVCFPFKNVLTARPPIFDAILYLPVVPLSFTPYDPVKF